MRILSELVRRSGLMLVGLLWSVVTSAQVNKAGTVHLGLSGSLGLHATTYVEKQYLGILGLVQESTTHDGAVSWTFPIDLQVGVAKVLSAGLYLEPGVYLDSSAAKSNAIFIAGLAPRFYLVNTDHFAWTLLLGGGIGTLQIEERYSGGNARTIYLSGGQLRIGTGVLVIFGRHVGLQAGLKYAYYDLPLRKSEYNGQEESLSNYDGHLTASGFHVDLGLAVRIGK
ncbi:MAG: hypothetical protein H6595_10580 [Flavobacteriales bacterium]|nr:hypothetical protein [Flavobacteriales bacterium]MCB9167907.1 hypothetical protein [Flavobacteriales bacterium]